MGRFRHEPCVVLGATSVSFSGMAMADRLGARIDPGPLGMAMADRLGARIDPGRYFSGITCYPEAPVAGNLAYLGLSFIGGSRLLSEAPVAGGLAYLGLSFIGGYTTRLL